MSGPYRSLPAPLATLRTLARQLRLLGLRLKSIGRFRLVAGRDINISRGVDIRPPQFIELGDHISFGKNFTCEANLRMGSEVLISSNVSVVGKDHPFDHPRLSVYFAPRLDESLVEIGDDVLVGFGSILIGSVRIGEGCIVGAGSVVTKDLPPYTICGGVPARPIRPRPRRGGASAIPEA